MNSAEFLLARITEDEEVARKSVEAPLHWRGHESGLHVESECVDCGGGGHVLIHATRVLAECAAKRRVVEGFLTLERDPNRLVDPFLHAQYKQWQQWFIRPFAAVYRDHPDYLKGWG